MLGVAAALRDNRTGASLPRRYSGPMKSRAVLVLAALLACRPTGSTSPPFAAAPTNDGPAVAPPSSPTGASDPAPMTDTLPEASPDSGPNESVHVAFTLSPPVGSAPPHLTVDIHNRKRTPLKMFQLEAPCFVHFLLSFSIVDSKGRAAPVSVCTNKALSGGDTTIPAGTHHRVTFALADVVGRLAPGAYKVDIGWDPSRLRETVGNDEAFDAMSSSLNLTEFAIARPLTKVRLARGVSKSLPGGASIEFTGNSHKHMQAGDGPGPLGVGGNFTPPRGKAESFDLWVHEGDSRFFTLTDGHMFELVDSAYDEWIEVRYFGKLAL